MTFSTAVHNFYQITIGAFFFIASVFTIYFAIWIFPQWQEVWYKGWSNLNTIASSVDGVSHTVEPLSLTAPVVVSQLKIMNQTVASQFKEMNVQMSKINGSMSSMNTNVQHLATTIPPMMGAMSGQLGRMQYNFTPEGMMKQVTPW
jgi:hypothetical protein